MLTNRIIEFKGMPLFQKASFKSPFIMQGEIKDFACFFYMTKGKMVSFDARGQHFINPKEAILKQCGNYVQRYESEGKNDDCEAIAVYLYPDLLKKIYQDEVPSFLKSEDEIPKPKKFIGSRLVEQYMQNLSIYFEEPDSLDEELGILKLKELMMILLKSEQHQDIRLLLSEIFAPVDVQFKETIKRNLFNPLTLDQLAFVCHMSLSTFKRKFKETYGETPAKYIKLSRLKHAASLLSCGAESVSNVAYDSGFQDLSTFSASFQEQYGQSPSQFRLSQSRK